MNIDNDMKFQPKNCVYEPRQVVWHKMRWNYRRGYEMGWKDAMRTYVNTRYESEGGGSGLRSVMRLTGRAWLTGFAVSCVGQKPDSAGLPRSSYSFVPTVRMRAATAASRKGYRSAAFYKACWCCVQSPG